MSAERRCKTCGVCIQENTAEATGGLCRPCEGGYRLNIERVRRQGPVEVTLISATWQTLDEEAFRQRRYERAAEQLAQCRAQIDQTPTSPQAHFRLGMVLHRRAHRYREALECYDRAIALWPQFAEALRSRAQLLSSCPDPALKDPVLAVRDALAALRSAHEQNLLHSDWVHRQYRYTLARSYAANGDATSALAALAGIAPFANTRISAVELTTALAMVQSGQRF